MILVTPPMLQEPDGGECKRSRRGCDDHRRRRQDL